MGFALAPLNRPLIIRASTQLGSADSARNDVSPFPDVLPVSLSRVLFAAVPGLIDGGS